MISNSNVEEITEFFSKKTARKKPIGAKRLIQVIKDDEIPIHDLITNKSVKEFLSRKNKQRKTWEMLSQTF